MKRGTAAAVAAVLGVGVVAAVAMPRMTVGPSGPFGGWGQTSQAHMWGQCSANGIAARQMMMGGARQLSPRQFGPWCHLDGDHEAWGAMMDEWPD